MSVKLTPLQLDHLLMLGRIGASQANPAFAVDFGELEYRTMGELIRAGLARKHRFYRYGENRRRVAYWLTLSGREALSKGEKGS